MRLLLALSALLPFALAGSAIGQPPAPYAAPQHKADWPGLITASTETEAQASFDLGPQLERGRSAAWLLADKRKLDAMLAAVGPQRPGVTDAYVVVAGFDSDPIFGREAREAGKVLARRYDAVGRTIVLGGSDGSGPSALPNGSPYALTMALARVAERMDKNKDVLVLYTTGHGAKVGLAYHDGDEGYGIISPKRLAGILDELGIKNRLLILSACYSGIFVPALANDTTALFTAASADRSSFGCAADYDWTFFGDAMINHALREPQPLAKASDEAVGLITKWEGLAPITPSNPQVAIGKRVATWLTPLEARMPKAATLPVGRPATDVLKEMGR